MSKAYNDMNNIEEKCDRRASRAAREIIMNKTVPILQSFHNGKDNYVESESFVTLPKTKQLELYGNLISDLIDPLSKYCLLKPEMDIFWKEEVGHKTLNSRSRRYPPGSRKYDVHICPICHKKFFNRYYLDLHMESQHQTDASTEMNICPSTVICNALTRTECNRMALEQEPHYAPGIQSTGSAHSNHIRLKFQKMVDSTPCSEHDLKKSNIECSKIINECFHHNKDLAHDLEHALCQIHTCERKLHALAGFSKSNIYKVQERFDNHHDVSSTWTILFAMSVLSLFCFKPIQKILIKYLNKKENGLKSRSTRKMDLSRRKKLD